MIVHTIRRRIHFFLWIIISIKKLHRKGPLGGFEYRLMFKPLIKPHDLSDAGSVTLNQAKAVKHRSQIRISGLRNTHEDNPTPYTASPKIRFSFSGSAQGGTISINGVTISAHDPGVGDYFYHRL